MTLSEQYVNQRKFQRARKVKTKFLLNFNLFCVDLWKGDEKQDVQVFKTYFSEE